MAISNFTLCTKIPRGAPALVIVQSENQRSCRESRLVNVATAAFLTAFGGLARITFGFDRVGSWRKTLWLLPTCNTPGPRRKNQVRNPLASHHYGLMFPPSGKQRGGGHRHTDAAAKEQKAHMCLKAVGTIMPGRGVTPQIGLFHGPGPVPKKESNCAV